MANEVIENYSKIFFIGSFIGITILSIYLMKSYIITIVGAILLAYVFHPVYDYLKSKLKNEKISSLLTILIVIILIIVPFIFAANALIGESINFFYKTKDLNLAPLEDQIAQRFGEDFNLEEQISNNLNKVSLSIARNTSDFVLALPKKALEMFVLLFLMFFLFIDGHKLVEKVKDHIPLKSRQKEELAKKFNNVIYASLYGMIVTAFVQGALAALGFWIFGIDSPILWGLITVIVAILPFLGASLIWLPAAIYKLVTGEMFNGVGLLLYGALIISTIDNIIRPSIIGSKAKIHPSLVLLGVLGGVEIFGLFGIIIGPLILSILTIFLDLYIVEKNDKKIA